MIVGRRAPGTHGIRRRALVFSLLGGTAAAASAGCPAFLSWDLPRQAGSDASTPIEGGAAPEAAGDAGACSGVCVILPSGWTGPWNVHEGEAGTTPPICTDGGPPSLAYGGLNAPPASCSPCSCDYADGGECSTVAVTILNEDNGNSCDAGPTAPAVYVDANCTPIVIDSTATIAISSSPVAGSCQPDPEGGQPTLPLPPAAFETVVAACPAGPAEAPCGSDGTCFAAPPQGFTLCVVQDGGASSCPSSFPNKHVYGNDQTLVEGRGCSACSCDPVAGSCQGGLVSFFDGGECEQPGLAAELQVPTMCEPPGVDIVSATIEVPPDLDPSGASCQPSIVQPAGSAIPANPVTYCCL